MAKNDVKVYFENKNIYIYTTLGIYELLCSEDYFYEFLNYNSKKGFSVSEGLEILKISGKIKFIG